MRNGRLHERKSVQVRGWIGGMQAGLVPCFVQDISAGGGKLIVENGRAPDTFKLCFSPVRPRFATASFDGVKVTVLVCSSLELQRRKKKHRFAYSEVPDWGLSTSRVDACLQLGQTKLARPGK